jgi:hypothetical protein
MIISTIVMFLTFIQSPLLNCINIRGISHVGAGLSYIYSGIIAISFEAPHASLITGAMF